MQIATEAKAKTTAKKLLKKALDSSEGFITTVLGVESLEKYQSRLLKTIDENDRIAIKACHDVGKTYLMARVVVAFLNRFPNSKVITTAPTFLQVEKLLWSEIRAAVMKSKIPLGGKLNTTDWSFGPEWFALGFTPRNEAGGGEGQGTQSSFQGFHAPYLLVVFDEATGIPPAVWVMVEGLLTSAHVKFVAIGNPTSPSSNFARCFKDRAWAKESLTCFDSPNLIVNGITNKQKLAEEIEKYKSMSDVEAQEYLKSYKVVRPYLLTAKWVVQNVAKWGMEHPLSLSKVFGEFPEAGDATLVPLNVVEQSHLRVYNPVASDRKIIGADVARLGTNATVLTALHGAKQIALKAFNKRRTTEVTGEIINLYRELGSDADVIVIDATGLGGGIVDELLEAQRNGIISKKCEIREVQFGKITVCEKHVSENCDHKLCNKGKYVNEKARMFDYLGKDMRDDRNGLMLWNESVYAEQLPTVQFKYNSKGQMFIESKDEYKRRTGLESPDYADSLALANFGRYDEMKIGTFGDSKRDEAPKRSTIAGGLNSGRNY